MKTRLTSLIILLVLLIIALTLTQKNRENTGKTFQLLKTQAMEETIQFWKFTDSHLYAVGTSNFYHLSPTASQFQQVPKKFIRVVFSPGGQFYATLFLTDLPESDSRDKLLHLEIFNANQEKIYSLQKRQYYDDPYPAVAISDKDGSLVLGRSTTTEVWFYDRNGQLVTQVQLLPEASYDLERFLDLQFDQAGNSLYMVTTTHGITPESDPSPLPPLQTLFFKFAPDGQKLWQETIPDFYTNFARVSENGNYLLISSYALKNSAELTEKTFVYNEEGSRVLETDFLTRYAAWKEASHQVLAANNRKAFAYDLKTGVLLWSSRITDKTRMITAVSPASKDERWALLIAKSSYSPDGFYFSEPEIKIFNGDGTLFQSISLQNASFKQPSLWLSADGKQIYIGLMNQYQVYRLQ